MGGSDLFALNEKFQSQPCARGFSLSATIDAADATHVTHATWRVNGMRVILFYRGSSCFFCCCFYGD